MNKLLYLFIITICIISTTVTDLIAQNPIQLGVWNTTTSFNTPRSSHTSVAYNGYLYVIGGTTDDITRFNDVQYAQINADGSLGAWQNATSFNTGRRSHTSVVYNGYLYVIGGTPNGGGVLNDVQYAPINADGSLGNWQSTTSFNTGRQSFTSVVNNGYLYVIQGFYSSAGSPLTDVQFAPFNADGSLGTWQSTTTFSPARFGHRSIAYNGYIYTMGGVNWNGSYYTLSDMQYSIINADGSLNSWQSTSPLDPSLNSPGLVEYNGYLIIAGGSNIPIGNVSDVKYVKMNSDGSLGSWQSMTSLNTARVAHTTVVYNGYLYVIGGSDNIGTALNSVEYAKISPQILHLAPFAISGQYLNDQIAADTVANGKLSRRVYMLQRGGIYLANAEIKNYNWTLRIRSNDSTTTQKAIVMLYPSSTTGNPPPRFIDVAGDVELKNLCITGYYEPADTNLRSLQGNLIGILSTTYGWRIKIDSCVLSNSNGNHIRTDGAASVIKVNNTVFANMGYLGRSLLGAGKAIDLRNNSIDSLVVQNCTFINSHDRIIRHINFPDGNLPTGSIGYLLFDHNTLVNGMSYHGLLSLGTLGGKAIITNNLLIDPFTLGNDRDSTRILPHEYAPSGEKDPYGNDRMTWIFSFPDLTTQWTISNNFYSISESGQEFYDDFATAGVTGEGSPLTWHINSRLGSDSVNAFKKIYISPTKVPELMTKLMRWYRSPSGGNKTKNTPGAWVYGDINTHPYKDPYDFDRKGYQWLQDSLNCSYLATESPVSSDGLVVGDTRWSYLGGTSVVTFQVDMSVKMREGTFLPASGDIVTLPASFNGWSTVADTLTDIDGDSIYTKTIYDLPVGEIQYKFYKTLRGGVNWEHDQPDPMHNRSYSVLPGLHTLPVVYFDNDAVVSQLVVYYPFNGNAHDESGNGNDGIVNGAVLTADRFGNVNSAYSFDGVSNYIVASADQLPTGERTISLWFNTNDLSTYPALLGYGGGDCGTSFLMIMNNLDNGANMFEVQGHCNVNRMDQSYPFDPRYLWHHWVVTTSAEGTKFYLDNVLIASNSTFMNNTNIIGKDLAIGVGVSPNGIAPDVPDPNLGFFKGSLDDICIYNRVLSLHEIDSLYKVGGWNPETPPLVGEYFNDANTVLLMHMNEESGSTVNDASSYNNDGTATGTTIVDGRFGKARGFINGERLSIHGTSSLFIGNLDFTVEMWIKSAPVDEDNMIVHKWNGPETDPGYKVFLGGGQAGGVVGTYGDSYRVENVVSTIEVDNNQWHHLALVRTGDNREPINLFIDGILAGSNSTPSLLGIGNMEELVIGLGLKAGLMDEVRISNIARSPQEFNLQLPPQNLTATASTDTVSLSWQNGGGAVPIMRYKVYRGSDSVNVILIDSTTSTNYIDINVPSGLHFYRISPVDISGFEGVKSWAVSTTVQLSAGEYVSDGNTVLLLHMNETSGSNTGDASSFNNHGTAIGTTINSGRFGNARHFNGTSDSVVVPHSTSLLFPTAFTFEAWVKYEVGSMGNSRIISKQWNGISDSGLELGFQGNGTSLPIYLFLGNSNLYSTSNLISERWYHVATSYDGSIVKLYINGRLDNFSALTIPIPQVTTNLLLGRSANNPSMADLYKGYIDEVRISNIARSPQEFNLQLPPKNLALTINGTNVNLNWQNGGGAVPLIRYRIYRGTDSLEVTKIDSTTSTNYSDNSVQVGSYYYRISAVDSTGFESAMSYAASTSHFNRIWSGPYLPMNIYVTSATIDGVNLESGDEIAVYDGDNCVGSTVLTESIPQGGYASIIASSDDPTTVEIDGFIQGNMMTFRFWDSNRSSEVHRISANFTMGTDQFSPQETSVVGLTGIFTVTQNVEMLTGWNIFSLRTIPGNPDMMQIMNSLITSGVLIKVQDETGKALEQLPAPFGWINSIGNWSSTEGYYLKVNAPSTLNITDPPVSLPINIPLKTGWNIISYPVSAEQNALTVLQPLIGADQLVKVQNEAGQAVERLPDPFGWVNTIGNFKSGEGYYVKVNAITSLSLNEPGPILAKRKSSTENRKVLSKTTTNHFVPVFTYNPYYPMNIYVPGAGLIGGGALGAGDEIGVFDGDCCVGAIVLTAPINPYVSIIVTMDDPGTPIKDGFITGHTITYKFWISSASVEISEYTTDYIIGDGTFSPQGTSMVGIEDIPPLPVELVSFTADIKDFVVLLNWQTATELNNYGFEVERKLAESETWKKIAFIAGNGNSNTLKNYEYKDKNATGGSRFEYRLKQLDNNGKYKFSNTIEVKLIPVVYELWQNYPNPFNMSTTLKYALPRESNVELVVYDILGKEIKSFSYDSQAEGYYNVTWEGTDNFGGQVSSGIYICRIKASSINDGKVFTKTIKLVLMK